MTNTDTATKTPGFNCRLSIRFSTDKNGRKLAHYWSAKAVRYIRVGTADAEMWIAQDLADRH